MTLMGELALALLVVLAVLVIVRFELFCLAELARTSEVRYLTRQAWTVVILFAIPIGGLLYLYRGRPD